MRLKVTLGGEIETDAFLTRKTQCYSDFAFPTNVFDSDARQKKKTTQKKKLKIFPDKGTILPHACPFILSSQKTDASTISTQLCSKRISNVMIFITYSITKWN